MLVRAIGLGKTFRGPDGGPIPVLDGVDVEVKPGEFVAVAGPSGSGKSTLLNLLGLLEAADRGEIWLDDVCVSRLSRRAQCPVRGRSIAVFNLSGKAVQAGFTGDLHAGAYRDFGTGDSVRVDSGSRHL